MDLLNKIYMAGVVGAGGAGFPTHIKLNCKVDYLIVNALECEPLLKTDQYVMRTKSYEIIKALEELGRLVEAKYIFIGIKEKYKKEIEALKSAINDLNSKVKLYFFESVYPAGDEQILVYEITGRVIPPGGIPLNVGTVVSNIGTVYNIYNAMEGVSVIDKYISVLGEVNEPKLLKVPIGVTVAQCLKACNGTTIDDYSIIMGGPMMGRKIKKDEINSRVITKTDSAIIVIPDSHYIIEKDKIQLNHIINRAKSACIQCRYCTEMCPRHLIGHPLSPHKIMRAIALSEESDVFKEAFLCSECGICELYACPMGLSPRRVNIYLKDKLKKQGIKPQFNVKELKAYIEREYRKIPTFRLISRLNLSLYSAQKIDKVEEISASKVKIPLKQHIGIMAKPVVNVGDIVEKGQLIGKVEANEIGANVHSSISGVVVEISKDSIVIENAE
uniref:4Fe-4S dicluster domain-containing protein n=1 Tax=Caloramator sp. E03 TaxID=2576307 RepID=UPI001110EF17|nr:4Fe-4S dicluster domain-containing protein [Caloramator sp. E03]QCX34519.1 proton-conducting membrane transporter [Caloramator sp. E03]